MVCARGVITAADTGRLQRPENFDVHPKRAEYSTKVKLESSAPRSKPFYLPSTENV